MRKSLFGNIFLFHHYFRWISINFTLSIDYQSLRIFLKYIRCRNIITALFYPLIYFICYNLHRILLFSCPMDEYIISLQSKTPEAFDESKRNQSSIMKFSDPRILDGFWSDDEELFDSIVEPDSLLFTYDTGSVYVLSANIYVDESSSHETYSTDEEVPRQSSAQQKRKYTIMNRTPSKRGKSSKDTCVGSLMQMKAFRCFQASVVAINWSISKITIVGFLMKE